MRRGTCLKCGAATVRAAVNGLVIGDRANATLFRPQLPPNFRGMTRTHDGQLCAFACATCGYLEFHIVDAATLAFIVHNWAPVEPVAAPPPATAPT